MKALIQRVDSCSVSVEGAVVSSIGRGMLALVGVENGDTAEIAIKLARKTAEMRIFEDAAGLMNLSVAQVSGSIMVVSQFTLAADTRKGRRPSFDNAARPEEAKTLYEAFVKELESVGIKVSTGVFREHMKVGLVNDGPVTFILEIGPHTEK